jgi:hypothetical protein
VIANSDLMKQLAPMLLLSEGANWLAREERVMVSSDGVRAPTGAASWDLAWISKQMSE